MRQFRLLACWLAGAACVIAVLPLPAAAQYVIDDVSDNPEGVRAGGDEAVPDPNPRARAILAAHPNQYVVLCLAGCDRPPKIVQILPRPTEHRTSQFVPTAATVGGRVYGPTLPANKTRRLAAHGNDVICLAGCIGRAGQVVDRNLDLPSLPPQARGTP